MDATAVPKHVSPVVSRVSRVLDLEWVPQVPNSRDLDQAVPAGVRGGTVPALQEAQQASFSSWCLGARHP